MTNEIVKAKEQHLTWSKSQMELIKRTVAKGSTDDEFNMFMYLAKTYQLDPITKEIWFIKYNEKAVPIIMTSRDGYLSIANRNPHYEGLTSDVVHENDEFEKVESGVKHKYGCKDRGKIIGAYALGYRNDRKYPVYVFAHFDEYFKKNSAIWAQYGSAMNLKVAEAMMFKRLFSISGLVTKEEIATEEDDVDITPKTSNQQPIENEIHIAGEKRIKEVIEEVFPSDVTTKQLDTIYGESLSGGIYYSPLLTKKEQEHIGLAKDMSKDKADSVIAWWEKGKGKKATKEEVNPKVGKNDLERRGQLMQEVLDLMKENNIKLAEKTRMYKKYQKKQIQDLATEELQELKQLLENYVPDWK